MKYKGQLCLHSEMCCGIWPQFHDDRGLYGDNNEFWSWDWTINFNKHTKLDNIKIFDKYGKVLYNGPWTYSKINTMKNSCIESPEEIDPEQWLNWLGDMVHCEIETDELVDALKEKKND